MKKIVLAMVDNTGVRATGRYRDRLQQSAEVETFPEARSCIWSDYSDRRLEQIKRHIASEAASHEWVGYFILSDTANILQIAKTKALKEAA